MVHSTFKSTNSYSVFNVYDLISIKIESDELCY